MEVAHSLHQQALNVMLSLVVVHQDPTPVHLPLGRPRLGPLHQDLLHLV